MAFFQKNAASGESSLQNVYRVRVAAFLTIPNFGRDADGTIRQSGGLVRLPVRVRKLHIVYNDHNLADECTLEAEYKDLGLDPRYLTNATVQVYIGEAKGGEDWQPSPKDLRFVGIMWRPARQGTEEDGLTMSLEFRDYTTLFLENKHFPPKADPAFDETLSQIWEKICDNTGPVDVGTDQVSSTVQALKNKLVFDGNAHDTVLGEAVAERFRKFGKFQRIHPDMDSWAIWQRCCGMLGLISFIYLDHCFVTTSRGFYTVDDPPVFIWGQNILSIHEDRLPNRGKGVVLVSYDPLTNSTIEARYPPAGDPRILKHSVPATTATGKPSRSKPTEDVAYFTYPSVTDPTRLQEIAERVYNEWSRQELEGRLTTVDLKTTGEYSRRIITLTKLTPGNSITVGFDPETKTLLKSLGSINLQVDYLMVRGYSEDAALYLVNNLNDIDKWVPHFFVKQVEIHFSADENSGEFKIDIGYCNHIEPGNKNTAK